jgi:hypothetical protein
LALEIGALAAVLPELSRAEAIGERSEPTGGVNRRQLPAVPNED